MVSKASDLFWEMSGKGIQPNLITYNSLCHDLCRFDRWKEAATLLGNLMRN